MEDRGTPEGHRESPPWTYLLTNEVIWRGRDSKNREHVVYDIIQYDEARELCVYKRIPTNPECKLYQSGWTRELFKRTNDTWERVTIDGDVTSRAE